MILFLAGVATGAIGILAVGYVTWRAEQRKLREHTVQAMVVQLPPPDVKNAVAVSGNWGQMH